MSETVAGAQYVVGFMFDESERSVLLLRKNRPTWQSGKLNGIGGRIEDGETPLEAMRREFIEEVGIDCESWSQFCVLGDAREWQIYFFAATGPVWQAQVLTDERPEIAEVVALPADTIPNLSWLIPMALNMKRERVSGFDIREMHQCRVCGNSVEDGESMCARCV